MKLIFQKMNYCLETINGTRIVTERTFDYTMAKILCEFEGIRVQCKVLENMGYQGGDYVKAVEYEGKERIVVKRGKIWRPKTVSEKLGIAGRAGGQ